MRFQSCRILIVSAAIALEASAGVEYEVVDLGTPGGDAILALPGSRARRVAPDGAVAGHGAIDDVTAIIRPFSWIDGVMTVLPPLNGDDHAEATALASADLVVGVSYRLGELHPRGVRWASGVRTNLDAFEPSDVDATGVMVGGAWTADPIPRRQAAWRDAGGTVHLLAGLGGYGSFAQARASDGRIVGESQLPENLEVHAVLWQDGFVRDLGTLGGPDSHAFDANGAGVVVGSARRANGRLRAVRWLLAPDGSVLALDGLGTIDGGFSSAFGVNEAGVIVGTSDGRAFRWQGSGMTDLNDLIDPASGWQLAAATSIDDSGLIAGDGAVAGKPRAFLLVPIRPTADLDGDGVVAFGDLVLLLAAWGPCPPEACSADLDGNGEVGFGDLLLLLGSWGP